MRFLITGVAGFVGRHLVEYLGAAYPASPIWGVDVVEGTDNGRGNPAFSYTQANLLDKEGVHALLRQAQPERIIHLASFSSVSYSWENPADSFLNNSLIFINVIEAVKKECPGCRVLSIGSSEEYGTVHEATGPVKETHQLSPTSPYAVARVSQELLSKVFVKGYGLDIIMTRSFNHIGPFQREAFVVPAFARQFIKAEKAGLREFSLHCGDLEVVRDFTDVRDVVRAYDLLLTHAHRGEIYNVCSGRGSKLGDIIRIMEGLTGLRAMVETGTELLRPVENRALVGDNGKIREHCGWKPEWSLEASIGEVLDYWRGVEK